MEQNGHTVIAGAIVVAAVIVAFSLSPKSGFAPGGEVGTVQAVTLVGGQVFFGKLAKVTDNAVILSDLVEAQTVTNPQTNQRSVQLLRRGTAVWHQPRDMAIPKERIQFTETVGVGSQVGKFVTEPPPIPPPAPKQ